MGDQTVSARVKTVNGKMTAEDSKADTASTTTDLGTPISCIACNKPSCHRLWRTFNNYWQLLALFFVVFFYTLIGGAIFNAVERPNELLNIQESLVARNNAINEFVDFLTNSTNLTTEEAVNVTGLFLKLGAVAAQADATLAVEDNPIWDFASAVFFCSTVITTIGYGTIAPSTARGQILFIFYAIIGIPLALMFLAQIGKILDAWVNRTLKPVEKRWGPAMSRAVGSTSLLLVVVIFFSLIPAVIFNRIETWNFRESVYYTFVTLTTVGFGDFVPMQSTESITNPIVGLYKIITTAWLWMGLALLAALITEVQDLLHDVAVWWRKTRHCCGVCKEAETEKLELTDAPGKNSKKNAPSPDPEV